MALLLLIELGSTGCATTQETVGAIVMGTGVLTAGSGIALSVDQHPRGRPDITTRQADPNVGIPVAMAGAVLLVTGFVIYVTTPHAHGSTTSSRQ